MRHKRAPPPATARDNCLCNDDQTAARSSSLGQPRRPFRAMTTPVFDIYQQAHNAVRARVADDGSQKRESACTDMSIRVNIDKESELMKKLYLRDHAPIPPEPAHVRAELARHRPHELLAFVAERQQQTDWASVLADPTAAAAMRQLKRRMDEINGKSGGFRESRWAVRVLNGQDGRARPAEHAQACSARNPFSYDALKSTHPLHSLPRTTALRTPPEAEVTSFWTAGFGASANQAAVDFNFKYGRTAERSSGVAGDGRPWVPPGRIYRIGH